MDDNWKLILEQMLHFHILSRGWILFRVKSEGDRQKLMGKSWKWGPSGQILKRWQVDFEADREPQNVQQVWAIFPGLPIIFWQKEILEAIGEKIGRFVSLKDNWEQKVDKRCMKFLLRWI